MVSQNSYTTADVIMGLWPKVIESGRITQPEIDGFITLVEGEINGALAARYTVPFPTSQLPLEPIKTIATLLAGHALLRSRITQEDPNRSDWVEGLRTRGEKLLDQLVEGTLSIVTTSGAVVGASGRTAAVWSNTSQFKPTADLRDPIQQRVDPDRLDAMDAADQ